MNRCQLHLRTLVRGGSHVRIAQHTPVYARWPRPSRFQRHHSQDVKPDNIESSSGATETEDSHDSKASDPLIRHHLTDGRRSSTARRLEMWLYPRMTPQVADRRERMRDQRKTSNAVVAVKPDLEAVYDKDAATADYIMGHQAEDDSPRDGFARYAWRTKRTETKQLYNLRPNFENRELEGRGLRSTGAPRHWATPASKLARRSIGVWQQNKHWIAGLNVLLRTYDKRYPERYLKDSRDSLQLCELSEQYVREFFALLDAGEDALVLFNSPGREERIKVFRWEVTALWLMVKKPADAIRFLEVTMKLPNRNKRHYQQALKYLVAHYFHSDGPDREARLVDLARLVMQLTATERFRWSDSTFNMLIKSCPIEVVQSLFTTLRDHYVVLHFHTWVTFASHLVDHGRFEESLQALFYARRAGAVLDTDSFLWTAASILRKSIRTPDGLRVCLRLTDHLSKSGLPMTTLISNILILNAVEADDVNTALSVYHSMAENGPTRDAYTFAAMLKACKKNTGNADLLNAIIRDAIDAGAVMTEPVVATEIIHCLIRHHTAADPSSAFEIVGDAYAELFDLKPMHELGLFTHKTQSGEKLQPDRHVMGMIFWAFLEYVHNNEIPVTAAQRLYSTWRQLMFDGKQPFADLAEDTYCYNAFIYYYARLEDGLLAATQIVKDMQQAAGRHPEQLHRGPDPTTWSLLVFAYIRRGKTKLAEQIVAYMRSKEIKPQLATWNELLTGYAGRQELDKVLDVLRRLEAMGLTWDQYTRAALTRFRDKTRLINALEREMPHRADEPDLPIRKEQDDTFHVVNDETGKPLVRKHHSSNSQLFDETAKGRDSIADKVGGPDSSSADIEKAAEPQFTIRRHVTAPSVPIRRITSKEAGAGTATTAETSSKATDEAVNKD